MGRHVALKPCWLLVLLFTRASAWTSLTSSAPGPAARLGLRSVAIASADTSSAVHRAWLKSVDNDGGASELSARLNRRSKHFDPALREMYENFSSAEKAQLASFSKEARPKRVKKPRRPPKCYAVLVDAENVSWRTMRPIMAKIGQYGDARVRRMYGDFSAPGLVRWAEVERTHSFMRVHQSALVKGKGCSDVLLAADAIKLRYENDELIDGFCIVSSDSDFAPLVKRLREAGKHVIGFGRAETPKPFQQACHEFVATDDLAAQLAPPSKATSTLPSTTPSSTPTSSTPTRTPPRRARAYRASQTRVAPLARDTAAAPALDALSSFCSAYERLKDAYAVAAVGAAPSHTKLRLSAADAKMEEIRALLQVHPASAQPHRRASAPPMRRGRLGRGVLPLGWLERTLHGWWCRVEALLASLRRGLHRSMRPVLHTVERGRAPSKGSLGGLRPAVR